MSRLSNTEVGCRITENKRMLFYGYCLLSTVTVTTLLPSPDEDEGRPEEGVRLLAHNSSWGA